VAARFGVGATKELAADFTPTCHPYRLSQPLDRKKPAIIFIGSMGDVFDPAIPDEFRDRIFATVAAAHWHTFVVLTKRAKEMKRYVTEMRLAGRGASALWRNHGIQTDSAWWLNNFPNLWLGVTVTNQADADERIPLLLDTPAAKRMVSVEPMLGPVDLGDYVWEHDERDYGRDHLDFVVVGGKTPGKPLHEQHGLEWNTELGPSDYLRSLRDQCFAAGVPLHYKHGGTNPALDGVVYDWRPDTAQSAEEEE